MRLLRRPPSAGLLNDKGGKAAHTFLFLSIVSLGALLYLNSNIFPPNHINYFLGKDKIKAEISGVIRSPDEARGVYYGKVSSRYVFEVETISNQYRSAIGNTFLRSPIGGGKTKGQWPGAREDTDREGISVWG